MYHCKFCEKECKNKMSQVKHEHFCKNNPNKLTNSLNKPNKKRSNQYIKAKENGTVYILSDEARENIRKGAVGRKISDEARKILKKAMQKAVKDHPDSYSASNVSGRTKSFDYIDSFGNKTKLKGKWELYVAEYLNEHSIKWTNKVDGFEYKWNGSTHIYFPDFYIPKHDIYIEVKGYERERDHHKWDVVDNLIIFRYKEILEIKDKQLNPLLMIIDC